MTTTTVSVELFSTEAHRRLIDSYEVMNLLGLRSREAVWKRVRSGTLPEPVVHKSTQIALWDRDALPA